MQKDEGIQISGGQWQQLIFSRTLVKNSSIYILDEPSAGLDIYSEKNMYELIDEIEDSMKIIVTHRLFTINKEKYRAIVIQDGEIVEIGEVKDLMNSESIYKNMYNDMLRK
ncbi:hypothetical protein Z956_09220 [Clostridium botulinum D str. CCUG 7971]|nr:ATP-binding cassette domain-containing protein [Clostridium botulinum]KGM94087.1 hypothetical protein Z956_09220 [Clostridium botulinum D str. CCUG 7971]KOC47441.1 hypothetical protein ADU88_10640 [Clostridium botulinum]OOV55580.1 hypothetical protein B1A68_10935 [Clostridium botulinum D/C]OOV61407.1 hypothetical protein B1A69_10055 [Clostridium botulinum D/C]